MNTLLVIGSNGQLGSELKEALKIPRDFPRENLSLKMVSGTFTQAKTNQTPFSSLCVDRDELDITDVDAVQRFFNQHTPDYCINAAAYTNVEKAEEEQSLAHAVNAQGAENIARSCAKNNTILFHISTDFVFDGKKTVPYTEEDEPHPLGAYGRTKYEGELAVQKLCPKSFIIRTSWLYSSFGHNFVKTILGLCKERTVMGSGTNSLAKLSQTPLPIVADQYGSPTYARDLAEALLRMIEKMGSGTDFAVAKTEPDPILFGIYHYANDGEVTWFEFAQKIRDVAGLSCEFKPITTSAYPTKVTRPAYSALSTKKIQHTFGVAIPDWDASLSECMSLLARRVH